MRLSRSLLLLVGRCFDDFVEQLRRVVQAHLHVPADEGVRAKGLTLHVDFLQELLGRRFARARRGDLRLELFEVLLHLLLFLVVLAHLALGGSHLTICLGSQVHRGGQLLKLLK